MNRKSSRRKFLKSFSLSAVTLCAAVAGMLSLSSLESWAQAPRVAPIGRPLNVAAPPPAPIGHALYPAAPPAAPMSRPLNIVTLGDSIMWGQGLPESMKFRTIVASWLQSQLRGRTVNQVSTHAHSGAVTGFGPYPKGMTQDPDAFYKRNTGYPYPGEVPFSYPTVSYQIGMTVADLRARNINPQDVDLVLVDGGINDVNIQNILNITDFTTNADWVTRITNQSVTGHMSQLLPQVLTTFPNAAVVITGYYPIVSKSSDLTSLSPLLRTNGIAVERLVQAGRDEVAKRANAFADAAFGGLLNLVNQTNRTLRAPRVALAWPAFSDDNAYAAPDSYLFRVNQFASDEDRGKAGQAPPGNLSTLQGVAYYRAEECSQFSNTGFCYDASMGHPNPAGARAYADAIITKLQTVFWARLGLPAPPPPPPKMIVRVVDTGVERLAATGPSSWNWVIVSATDAANASPVRGATVTVNTIGGSAPGPAGRSYYKGPTGQKIYYVNGPGAVRTPVGRPATERREATQPLRIKVTVAAPGYIPGSATITID